MSESVHQLILASAGTGKTYRLTNRFLDLLLEGVDPERILATTFTRKAAGEILDRVLERLVEASEDAAKLSELAEALERSDLTAERCRSLLVRLTRSIDTFQVRTIDSFFVLLVRIFALDLELPASFSIASEGEDASLRSEAMEDVLERTPSEQVTELLRDLDSGGAGRSVHQSMLERAGRMHPIFVESAENAFDSVHAGAKPSDAEWAAAVEGLAIARESEVPTTGKGRPNGHWVKAVDRVLEQAAARDWDKILGQGLGNTLLTPGGTFQKSAIPDALAERLEPIVQRAKYEFLTRLSARNLATRALLERFDAAYAERKRERGAYRFDDLPRALSPRSAAESPIEARELDMWFRLDSRIDHLLLDEFQDTSPMQWRVLEKIASEIAADGTGERRFFCVGDVKQSIYGFRQAEPRLLAELPSLLPGLVPEEIHKSYRSSRVVIETINRVFCDLSQNGALAQADVEAWWPAIDRWQSAFREHEAALDLPGAAFLVEVPAPAEEGEGTTADSLLERTVERVGLIVQEAPEASVGILMRDGKQIPGLIHRLRLAGVEASGEGGHELTDSAAVLAFVSLLHLADHPGDRAAAFHVASSRLGEYFELPIDPDSERNGELAREVRARLVAEGLGAFCADVGGRIAADSAWSDWDRARFEQLVELAFGFEKVAGLRPSDFVDHVRSQRVESPGGAQVRVMTIHGAKGLEFDAVVLPELQKPFVRKPPDLLVDRPRPDGLIETVSVAPTKPTLIADERLKAMYDSSTARSVEDGLCTLYVAITRAKRRLDLIVPWSDPEKKVKTPCPADILRAALLSDEIAEPDSLGVLWSHEGNASGSGWADRLATESSAAIAGEPAVASLGLAASTRSRTLRRRSPSAEEGGRLVRADSLLRDKRGSRRGSLVHRWLEDLEWIEDFELDEANALAMGAAIEPDPATRREALAMLSEALRMEPVRAALSREACEAKLGADLEVRNEHAFSLLLPDESGDEQLWTGFIDRLVLARQGGDVVRAEVIDYKTDALAADDLADRVEYYRPQLESYGRVVAAQTGLPLSKIRLRLIFLHPGRVVDL